MARKPRKRAGPKKAKEEKAEQQEPHQGGALAVIAKPEHRGPGKPTTYTKEAGEEICRRIAAGETLTAICKDDHMPARSTEFQWREANREYADAYARARIAQAEGWADEMIEIGDDKSFDFVMTPQGPMLDREHIQRSRLRFDTRRFLVAKYAPRLFGDKVQVEASGPNGGAIETKTTLDLSKLSVEALAEIANVRIKSD